MLPRHRLRHLLDLVDDDLDGLLDAALELHRVGAGRDVLRALAIDRLRQHGRGGGAVAGHVRRLARDLAHHLRAHVLERILEVDLLGDRHAVLGDGRGAELLVEDDVAALGSERDLHRVGELVDAAQDRLPRLLAVDNLFCHVLLLLSIFASLPIEDREHFVLAHDEVFLAIELDLLPGVLAEQNRVARLDVERLTRLPSSLTLPVPTAMTLPCCGFSLAVSGMMIPPTFCSPSSMR